MNNFLSRLNLRPQERRLVVFIALVFFVVLNVLLVWPHFGDWSRLQVGKKQAKDNLKLFKAEIEKQPLNVQKLQKLEGQGSAVLPADQALELIRTVQNQARQSGVNVPSTQARPNTGGRPNEFFEEQGVQISVNNTGDKELVDFLVKLGSGNSMIRVRDLDLRPQLPAQQRLEGSMVLIASYQKKPSAKSAPAAKPPALSAKPATNLQRAVSSGSKTSSPVARATVTNSTRVGAAPGKKP